MTQTAIDIQYQQKDVSPYRTPQMDLDLWKQTDKDSYDLAMTLVGDKNPTGVNWNGTADTWDAFCDRDDTVPVITLQKDILAQRPINFESLLSMIKRAKGVFDHAQASSIDVAYREDGSSNVWDHWHTTMFAFIAGVSHLRVSKLIHIQKTLEECRAKERNMFEGRNVFSLKTNAGQAHEFKVKRILTENGTEVAYDADVAVSKIFAKLNLTTTGSKTSYTKVAGIAKIKEARKMWQHHLKAGADNSAADKRLENILKMWTEVFPNEKIDATLTEALSFAMINFTHVESFQLPKIKAFFTAQKLADFPKMSSYGREAIKMKHKSKESLALFLVYKWNDWMFNSGNSSKRPITIKVAEAAFADSFPKTFINSVWVQTTQTVDVTCPTCSTTWEEKITI